eukprot:6457410-Amphidinium_carterae.1
MEFVGKLCNAIVLFCQSYDDMSQNSRGGQKNIGSITELYPPIVLTHNPLVAALRGLSTWVCRRTSPHESRQQ